MDLDDICEMLGGKMERGKCILALEGIEVYNDDGTLELKFEGGTIVVDAYWYPEKVYVPLNVKIWNEDYSKMSKRLRELYWNRRKLRKEGKDTSDLDREIKELERKVEKFKLV
ncbi:MAG: hypothetical protein ACXQS2_03025 [Methermicoccaceae archaeon]